MSVFKRGTIFYTDFVINGQRVSPLISHVDSDPLVR